MEEPPSTRGNKSHIPRSLSNFRKSNASVYHSCHLATIPKYQGHQTPDILYRRWSTGKRREGVTHSRNFKLTPRQPQVLVHDLEYGFPRKPHVVDVELLLGLEKRLEVLGACGEDMVRHAGCGAYVEVQDSESLSLLLRNGVPQHAPAINKQNERMSTLRHIPKVGNNEKGRHTK